MARKNIVTIPNKLVKEGIHCLNKIKSDANDDFIRSLKPAAVRLKKNVTEDGVRIPLNF